MKRANGFLFLLVSLSVHAFSDPTRPFFYKPSTPQGLMPQHTLSAIISKETGRIALVDGQLVKVGDTIGDSKIIEIGVDVVQLETPRGRINLFLPGRSVRSPVAVPAAMEMQGKRE